MSTGDPSCDFIESSPCRGRGHNRSMAAYVAALLYRCVTTRRVLKSHRRDATCRDGLVCTQSHIGENPAMPTAVPAIIDLSTATAVEEVSAIPGDRLIAGSPVQAVRNLFADSTGQFFVGIWSSTPGLWRIRYTESEYCHLLEGAVRLTDSKGKSWSFSAGDRFVIPAGFTGTWEVVEPARKLYALFEPRG